MIEQIRIQNFKSIRDVTVELSPVTVLIGRSGVGKSNFLRAIRFLRNYLLNADAGFFPFELNADSTAYTVLYNRSHLVVVTLLENTVEAQLDPGYTVATEREVRMLLSNGESVEGRVRVYRPSGRDRVSDYARMSEMFRYVETDDATLIINSAHIVELREIGGV